MARIMYLLYAGDRCCTRSSMLVKVFSTMMARIWFSRRAASSSATAPPSERPKRKIWLGSTTSRRSRR
eukprot:766426-Hanusia_phi.AAC.1